MRCVQRLIYFLLIIEVALSTRGYTCSWTLIFSASIVSLCCCCCCAEALASIHLSGTLLRNPGRFGVNIYGQMQDNGGYARLGLTDSLPRSTSGVSWKEHPNIVSILNTNMAVWSPKTLKSELFFLADVRESERKWRVWQELIENVRSILLKKERLNLILIHIRNFIKKTVYF